MTERSELYNSLKDAGATFAVPYNKLKLEDLRAAAAALQEAIPEQKPVPAPELPPRKPQQPQQPKPQRPAPNATVPRGNTPLSVMAGEKVKPNPGETFIRIDDQGRHWLQEEVRKPAYPKPRGRRRLQYTDSGSKKQTVRNGEYLETFEVPGDEQRHMEVTITLPSFQVGIYRTPKFPWRVHTYGGNEGFNFRDINEYYGGEELVPREVKTIYVENAMCYDIRSVIRAVTTEHRENTMKGLA